MTTTAAKVEPATPEVGEHRLNVFEALQRVMRDVKAIGKDSLNRDQGYRFRGIDAVMTAVHPILAEHGVFFTPDVLERVPEQRTTARGSQMNVMHLHIRFTFYGPDGSSVTCTTWGEGQDMADKATNKAMSAALKYALVQVLCIPSDDMLTEGDTETVEAARASDPVVLAELETDLERAATLAELRVFAGKARVASASKKLSVEDAGRLRVEYEKRVTPLEAAENADATSGMPA